MYSRVPLLRWVQISLLVGLTAGCSITRSGALAAGSGGGSQEPASAQDAEGSAQPVDPLKVPVGGVLQGVAPGIDSDGDGVPDVQEGTEDANGNGVPAHLDTGEPLPADTADTGDGGANVASDAGEAAEADAATGPQPPAPGAVGSACSEDSECDAIVGAGGPFMSDNPGVCLLDTGGFFATEHPGGYCTAPCLDNGGPGQETGCGTQGVCTQDSNCLSFCDSDAECRVDEGYHCDLDLGGCTDDEL